MIEQFFFKASLRYNPTRIVLTFLWDPRKLYWGITLEYTNEYSIYSWIHLTTNYFFRFYVLILMEEKANLFVCNDCKKFEVKCHWNVWHCILHIVSFSTQSVKHSDCMSRIKGNKLSRHGPWTGSRYNLRYNFNCNLYHRCRCITYFLHQKFNFCDILLPFATI